MFKTWKGQKMSLIKARQLTFNLDIFINAKWIFWIQILVHVNYKSGAPPPPPPPALMISSITGIGHKTKLYHFIMTLVLSFKKIEIISFQQWSSCNLWTHLHLKHNTQAYTYKGVILAEELCSGTPKNIAMSLYM